MAKSSLTFSERRHIKYLNGTSYAVGAHQCGVVFALHSLKGTQITLPAISELGEGWNCRFLVSRVQNDLFDLPATTITAVTGDTILSRLLKEGGGLAGGTKATLDKALDITGIAALAGGAQGALTREDFSIGPIPASAGGSNTTFTVKFVKENADLPGTNAAATFVLSLEGLNTDTKLATAIVNCIKGEDNAVDDPDGTCIERPASGEGSEGSAIRGITAAVDGTKEIDITAEHEGILGNIDPIASLLNTGGAANVKVVKGNAENDALAGGANKTAAALSGQVITVEPSGATLGDVLDLAVCNGLWVVNGRRKQ